MDINAISSVIGSLGFPIAACIYMAYINQKQEEIHKQEMAKVTEAINELKVAIVAMTAKFESK